MKQVFLLGAGGFSKQVIDTYIKRGIKIRGIFDDFRTGYFYRNIPVIGKFNDVRKNINNDENLFITLGDNDSRLKLFEEYKDYSFPNCIRINSDIPEEDSVKLGIGNYIGSYCKLGEDSVIGNFNFINECCIIAHDTEIGSFNHLSPNVSMGGKAKIGNGNMIGTSSIIIPNISILDNIIFGAGSVIIKNVNESGVYVGNPIRKV